VTVSQLPPPIPHEIFRGYELDDLVRVERLGDAELGPTDGVVTDYFGVKYAPTYAPWFRDRAGTTISTPPFPTDTFLAEGIEYAALAYAMERTRTSSFTAFELGAGFGPWAALFATCGRRAGFDRVNFVAVEADAQRFADLRRHLALNDIVPLSAGDRGSNGHISWHLVNAAIWWRDETLYWPAGDVFDSGRVVSAKKDEQVDYRGRSSQTLAVPAISLPDLLTEYGNVDYVHIDVQGSEAEIIPRTAEHLERHVKYIFIGTHSRKIEGDIIEFLISRGWTLLREQPCVFNPTLSLPNLAALTIRDGGQFWGLPNPTGAT
jgi:FkbM family methyltransferase